VSSIGPQNIAECMYFIAIPHLLLTIHEDKIFQYNRSSTGITVDNIHIKICVTFAINTMVIIIILIDSLNIQIRITLYML
jgi:hypothetical protein